MQHAGLQYGQGAANSHQSPPFVHAADISQSGGGNTTSSLRQFRKKDGTDKQTGPDLNVGENIARVAPHSHYPARPNTDYYRYHQYPDYSSPYKEASTGPPVKYSEIAEPPQVQPPPIQHVDPVHALQKHHHNKDKEFMEMCNISQQAVQHVMKAHHQVAAYQDGGMNRTQQGYGPPDAASMYLHNKEQQMHGYKTESQYAQQYAHAKYNMTAPPPQCARKYAPPPPQQAPLENDFLAKLQRLNPSIARSIMSDHHIRESQYSPQYAPPPMQPHPPPPPPPPPPQNQRYYPNYYYPYNSSCNYPSRGGGGGGVGGAVAPQPNARQYDRPPSPRRMYHHQDYGNAVPPPQKISPQYPYGGTPEYAQHYQHRRVTPQEYYRNQPQVSPNESDSRASSGLRDYIQNWNIGEEEPPPAVIPPMETGGVASGSASLPPTTTTAAGGAASEQLFVINSSEISPQCLESLSLIPTENGQYILKPTAGLDSSLVRINIDKTSEEHSVNLQIVEAPKTDCMLADEAITDLVQQASSPIKDMPLIDDLGNEENNSTTESEETDDSQEKPEIEEIEERVKKKIFSVDDIMNCKEKSAPEEKSEAKREDGKIEERVAAAKENEEVHAISVENDSIIIEMGGVMVQLNLSQNNGSKVLNVVSLTESLIIDVNGNYSKEDREETKAPTAKDTAVSVSREKAASISEETVGEMETQSDDASKDIPEEISELSEATSEKVTDEILEETEKISEELSTNISEETEELSTNISEETEELSKDISEETEELPEETQDLCKEISEKTEELSKEVSEETDELSKEIFEKTEDLTEEMSEEPSEGNNTGVPEDTSETIHEDVCKTSKDVSEESCEDLSTKRTQKMSKQHLQDCSENKSELSKGRTLETSEEMPELRLEQESTEDLEENVKEDWEHLVGRPEKHLERMPEKSPEISEQMRKISSTEETSLTNISAEISTSETSIEIKLEQLSKEPEECAEKSEEVLIENEDQETATCEEETPAEVSVKEEEIVQLSLLEQNDVKNEETLPSKDQDVEAKALEDAKDIEETLEEIVQNDEILLEMDECCQNEIVIGEETEDVPLFAQDEENTDEEIRKRSEEIVANLMKMKQQQEEILEKSSREDRQKASIESARRKLSQENDEAPIPMSVKVTEEGVAVGYGIEVKKKLAVTLEKLRPEDIRNYMSEDRPKKKFREIVAEVVQTGLKKIDNIRKQRPCSASKAEERRTKKKKRNASEENRKIEERKPEENRKKDSSTSRRNGEDASLPNEDVAIKRNVEIDDSKRRIGRRRWKNVTSEDDTREIELGRLEENGRKSEEDRSKTSRKGEEIRQSQSEERRINEATCQRIDEEIRRKDDSEESARSNRRKRTSEEKLSDESGERKGRKPVEFGKRIEEIGRKCAERRNEEIQQVKIEKRLTETSRKIGSIRRKTREFSSADRKGTSLANQNEESGKEKKSEDAVSRLREMQETRTTLAGKDETKAREDGKEVIEQSKEEANNCTIEEEIDKLSITIAKPQKKREEDVRIKKKNSCTMCDGCKHGEQPQKPKRRSEDVKKDGGKKLKIEDTQSSKPTKKIVTPEKKENVEEKLKDHAILPEESNVERRRSEDKLKKKVATHIDKRKARKSVEEKSKRSEEKPKVVEEVCKLPIAIADNVKKDVEKLKKFDRTKKLLAGDKRSRVFSTKAAKKLYVSDIKIKTIPSEESDGPNENQRVLDRLDEAIKDMEQHTSGTIGEERVKKPKKVTFALVEEEIKDAHIEDRERQRREESRRQEEKKKLSWAEYHSRRKKVNGAYGDKTAEAKRQNEGSEEAKGDENLVDVLEKVEMSIEEDIRAKDGINQKLESELGTAYEMVQKVCAQAYASSDYSFDEGDDIGSSKDTFEERSDDCLEAANPDKPEQLDDEAEEIGDGQGERLEEIKATAGEATETVVEEIETVIEEEIETVIEEEIEAMVEEEIEVREEEIGEILEDVEGEIELGIVEIDDVRTDECDELKNAERKSEDERNEETSTSTSTLHRSTPKMDNSWEDDDDEDPQPFRPKRGVFIDANEFDIKPVSSSFPEDDTLQNYKDVVDLKLSSLSIQIPKPKPKSDPAEEPIQVLLERFLRKGLLDGDQLERVKRIIEVKRQLEGENHKAAARKYQYEVYQNGGRLNSASTSTEQIKMSIRRVSSEETKKKKRRFRNLNAITSDESEDDGDDDEDEEDQEYSVYQRTGTGVPKLIFKRKPGLPQPYVKLERSQTAELLVKKRKLY